MYEDVIKLLKTNMETHLEDEIMQAVMRVGVVVDKDGLIKALAYDREQYQKGYQDGKKDAVVHGRWDDLSRCTACGKECSVVFKPFEKAMQCTKVYIMSPFCPNCGAKMDLEEEE